MKESAFSRALKPHLPGDVTRIESGSTECGIPDINGSSDGVDYWVENKVCDNKRDIRMVTSLLRSEQKVWHLARVKQGARIFVCVKYPFGIDLYWARHPGERNSVTAVYRRVGLMKSYADVGEQISILIKAPRDRLL